MEQNMCEPLFMDDFRSPPFYECSNCKNQHLVSSDHKYCGTCGSKINWERLVLKNETI